MSGDQQMVRLRRNTTSTPWGFRMQGGNEYGAILFIQKVNPKSVAARQGLREGDRLLYINGAPVHQMNHEQAKMEIIRGGNELDILVQRNAVQIPHRDKVDSRSQTVEESTDYRGYTNPNVQSRSFKIIQQSLSVEEAEEGSFTPAGAIPGEMIVVRAYNEGRKRMAELSETHPRNFTSPGMSPYKGRAEYYGIEDYDEAQKFRASEKTKEAHGVASAKKFEGVKSPQHHRPPPENAHPQYNITTNEISPIDSILSPNVQGRRPMVVNNVPNEQQQPVVQHHVGMVQAQRVQQGSRPQTLINVQQAPLVHHDVHMANAYKISQGPPYQTPVNFQQTQHVVQQNAYPVQIQTSSVTQQPQKHVNITQVMSHNIQPQAPSAIQPQAVVIQQPQKQVNITQVMSHNVQPQAASVKQPQPVVIQQPQKQVNIMQIMSHNAQPQAPSVIQPQTVVIQQQKAVIQTPPANPQQANPPAQVLNIMHVEKTPTVVAPVVNALKDEPHQPAKPHRRVRPTKTIQNIEKEENQQLSKVTVEDKTISATPDVVQEAPISATPNVVQEAPISATPDVEQEAPISATPEVEQEAPISAIPDVIQEAPKQEMQAEITVEQKAEGEQQPVPHDDNANKSEPVTENAEAEAVTQEAVVNEKEEQKEIVAETKDTEEQVEKSPVAQENEPFAKATEPHTQVQEEPSPADTSQTLPVAEISEVPVEQRKPPEEKLETDTEEFTEKVSEEKDINSKIEAVSQNEVVEIAETYEKSETEVEQTASESKTVKKEPDTELVQTSENAVTSESIEASLNVESENVQEVTIQSTDNDTEMKAEAESFTLTLNDEANYTGVDVSADSAEFLIDTTNIEVTSEVDADVTEPSETLADIDLTVTGENVDTETSADVSLSLSEENEATVTIGLSEENSLEEAVAANDAAVDFSISINEEMNEESSNKTENVVEQKSENATSDVEVKKGEKDSKQETDNVISNKEDTKDLKPKEDKAQSKTKSKVSPNEDKSDKNSAPWRSRRANFVDSQGGVQARLQRLQKK